MHRRTTRIAIAVGVLALVGGAVPTHAQAGPDFTITVAAQSTNHIMRTQPEPVRDPPVLVSQNPKPDSVVSGVRLIEALFESNTTITPEGVDFFLDQTLVRDRVYVTTPNDGSGRYKLVYESVEPLSPGRHHVTFEATNEDGGKAVSTWSFTVESEAGAPMPSMAIVVGSVIGAACMLARRRR